MVKTLQTDATKGTRTAMADARTCRLAASFDLEKQQIGKGYRHVAGIDEAGRGPLAGPVVAAAVIFDPQNIPAGLADSKTLSPRHREFLFDAIIASARALAIGMSPAQEIDAINIRQATFAAMRRALAGLADAADFALIDGRDVPPDLPCPAAAFIKGDARSLSIAAASIIAKVTRDRLMTRLSLEYPQYGFDRHVGYPTTAHREALARLGATPFHRRSFAPVKNLQKN